jgi:hypothetical protein
MNSLPCVPKYTVVFLPSRTKVNTSPYCLLLAYQLPSTLRSTNLRSAIKEEFIRVKAISNTAADNWEPVKDHRRLVGVLEKKLLQDVYYDNKDHEDGQGGGNSNCDCMIHGKLGLQGPNNSLEDAHDDGEVEDVRLRGYVRA